MPQFHPSCSAEVRGTEQLLKLRGKELQTSRSVAIDGESTKGTAPLLPGSLPVGKMLGLCFPPRPKIISKLQGAEGLGREREFLFSGCQSGEAAAHNEKCIPSLCLPCSSQKSMGSAPRGVCSPSQGSLLPPETKIDVQLYPHGSTARGALSVHRA